MYLGILGHAIYPVFPLGFPTMYSQWLFHVELRTRETLLTLFDVEMAASIKSFKEMSKTANNVKQYPLFIFYDSEAADSNTFTSDIIEIGAKCFPDIRHASFQSVIYSAQQLSKFGKFVNYILLLW